jgi:cephalosporin-C deacetylase
MPWYDLPLDQLRTYNAGEQAPPDFDAFWQNTLAEQEREHPLEVTFAPHDEALYRTVRVFDVTFTGCDGQPIRGWLTVPAAYDGPLPCIVSYAGYGGGRGRPLERLGPAAAGFAHLMMDTRGQGSVWATGDTPDNAGAVQQHPGFLTSGIESRERYYYRRVFVDAVRAVRAAQRSDAVLADRICVAGSSQGGGIALAAAALLGDDVRICLADVPFLCHFRRAVTLTTSTAYAEIAAYLRIHPHREQQVWETLAYFDGVFFAERIRARTLVAVGLMDEACPPSTVFAAYNRIAAPKEIAVYSYDGHAGGGAWQEERRLRFVQEHL